MANFHHLRSHNNLLHRGSFHSRPRIHQNLAHRNPSTHCIRRYTSHRRLDRLDHCNNTTSKLNRRNPTYSTIIKKLKFKSHIHRYFCWHTKVQQPEIPSCKSNPKTFSMTIVYCSVCLKPSRFPRVQNSMIINIDFCFIKSLRFFPYTSSKGNLWKS